MKNSKISWLDGGHTVNLWWGCSKVHTGCKNCYAESISNRYGNDIWGENKKRKRIKSATKDLNKYQKQAEKESKVIKVFMGSMMDIFEESKPLITNGDTGVLRQMFFSDIFDGKYPNLVFLFLTKRPENINLYIPEIWKKTPPKNVWYGLSLSDQQTAEEYMPVFREVKGNKFLSIEPQVRIIQSLNLTDIDWVIQGGESGTKKRLFKDFWALYMRDICKDWKVPYFLKQIHDKNGKVRKDISQFPRDLQIRQFPKFNNL